MRTAKNADGTSLNRNQEFLQQMRNENANKIFPTGYSSCSSDSFISEEDYTAGSKYSFKIENSKDEPNDYYANTE